MYIDKKVDERTRSIQITELSDGLNFQNYLNHRGTYTALKKCGISVQEAGFSKAIWHSTFSVGIKRDFQKCFHCNQWD